MSGIRFTSNVKVSVSVLRESLDKSLEENEEIFSNLVLSSIMEYGGGRETSAQRLIKIKNVSNIIPGIRVGAESLSVVIDLEGTVFYEETEFTRAAGSTSKPDDERILGSLLSRFEKPVEKMASLVNGDETGVESFIEENRIGVLDNFR